MELGQATFPKYFYDMQFHRIPWFAHISCVHSFTGKPKLVLGFEGF